MVYVLLAKGFEETEALCTVDFLRRAGLEVLTVGMSGEMICGAHGISVVCDTVIESISDAKPQMLVLPGGMPGVSNLDTAPGTDNMISETLENGGIIGAVCAAPMILGKRGLLKGRRAVCFPGFEKYLFGAEILSCDVVRDGNFVTSRSMGTVLAFATELTASVLGRDKADETLKAVIAARENA